MVTKCEKRRGREGREGEISTTIFHGPWIRDSVMKELWMSDYTPLAYAYLSCIHIVLHKFSVNMRPM